MESKVALLLVTPRLLGGFGIRGVALNHVVEVPRHLWTYARRRHLVLDAYVASSRTDIEFNGERWHVGAEAQKRDAERAGVLHAMGIEVVTLWARDVYDEAYMTSVAASLVRDSGTERRRDSLRCLRLRSELFAALREEGNAGGA